MHVLLRAVKGGEFHSTLIQRNWVTMARHRRAEHAGRFGVASPARAVAVEQASQILKKNG